MSSLVREWPLITVRVPPRIKQKTEAEAHRERRSVAQQVLYILEQHYGFEGREEGNDPPDEPKGGSGGGLKALVAAGIIAASTLGAIAPANAGGARMYPSAEPQPPTVYSVYLKKRKKKSVENSGDRDSLDAAA